MEAEQQIEKEILSKRLSVKDLQQNTRIEDIFAIASISIPKIASSNNWFIPMVVSDSTGQIKANFWGGPEEVAIQTLFQKLPRGCVVLIKGSVKPAYNAPGSEIAISLRDGDYIKPLGEGEYKCESFLPVTNRDRRRMVVKIQGYASSIAEPHLKNLIDAFFNDDDFVKEFTSAPAGKKHHGACIGGLLEHTINVVDSCDALSKVYTHLNRDLLIAGALLHDIGKTREYSMKSVIDLTDNCIFCGHITTGAEMVSRKCDELGIPPEVRGKIIHMVLASHGRLEFGSPVKPSLPEAEALHYVDYLDAQLDKFSRVFEENNGSVNFVYDRDLERYVYLK